MILGTYKKSKTGYNRTKIPGRTRPHRPWSPRSLLYNGYRVSFPEVKRPGRCANHPPPSNTKACSRVNFDTFFKIKNQVPFVAAGDINSAQNTSATQYHSVFGSDSSIINREPTAAFPLQQWLCEHVSVTLHVTMLILF